MALRGILGFRFKFRGSQKVKAMLDRAQKAAGLVYSQKALEKLLVARTKGRFNEFGAAGPYSSVAGRDPDGVPWKPLAASTTNYRSGNPGRALFVTGALRDSIGVTRSNMGKVAVQSPSGGGFSIGVRNTTAQAEGGKTPSQYARFHQFGTATLPQRRFLGIGAGDVKAVDDWIARQFKKQGINVK